MASVSAETPAGHGHSFSKKTFHKPTYCHHCTDMLWGLIQQGYICEGNCISLFKYVCMCVTFMSDDFYARGQVEGGEVLGIAAAAEARAVLFPDSIQLTPLPFSLTGWTARVFQNGTFCEVGNTSLGYIFLYFPPAFASHMCRIFVLQEIGSGEGFVIPFLLHVKIVTHYFLIHFILISINVCHPTSIIAYLNVNVITINNIENVSLPTGLLFFCLNI